MGARVLKYVGLCFCLFLLSVASVGAQSSGTGALTGTVKDSSGSVMANVTVTVTSNDTNVSRVVSTNASGSYTVPLLLPGTYHVKFEAPGFKTVDIPAATVIVGETGTLDGNLEVGAQTQVVTVSGEVMAVQTATSTVGTDITSQNVQALPLTTRNYTQILGLAAGTSSNANNASALGKGSQNIAVNGAPATSNNFQMDGVTVVNSNGIGNVQESGSYSSFGIPSPDAIEEFKIQTSLFDASSGRNSGANVNVVTKSGTNDFHGSLFEFFRNTDLNSNDIFLKASGKPRPELNQNQFGGVVGGPIKKDKLFFFVSYQETRQKNGATATGLQSGISLPPINVADRSNTAALKAALGASISPLCAGAGPGTAATPAFGTAFANPSANPPTASTLANAVQVACDGSNINQVALNILQLKNPDGTYYIPGGNNPTNYQSGVTYSAPASYTEHQVIGNFDYVINSKNTFSARYFWGSDPTVNPFSCGGGGLCVPDTATGTNYVNHEMVGKLTTILSDHLVNEARLALQRNLTNDTDLVPFTNSQVGIANVTPGVDIFDQILVAGRFSLGGYGVPVQTVNVTQWEAGDTLSWTHGRHTVRFGGELERDRWNWLFPAISQGTLNFQTFADFLLGLPGCAPGNATCTPANPGNTNGTSLSNIFNSGTITSRGPAGGIDHHFNTPVASLFVQDDFKVNQRLTLNLGLRWEYQSVLSDSGGLLSNFNPNIAGTVTPGTTLATGTLVGFVVPANYVGAIPAGVTQYSHNTQPANNTPKNDFGPRVGFAFLPTSSDKLVIRGGGGIFFDRIPGNNYSHAAVQGVPYSATISQGNAANYFSTFAQPYNTNPLGWTPRWASPATLTGSGLNIPYVDPNFVTPAVFQYNLNVQWEFAPSWVLEIGYVGLTGWHQDYLGRPENQAMIATATNIVNGLNTSTAKNANYRVPYLGITANGMAGSGTEGNVKSNDFQATVRKRLTNGLSMQASYTFVRSFTTQNTTAAANVGVGAFIYNDVTNTRAQYSLSSDYHPQRVAVNYSYDLPFKNHNGIEGKLVDGWTVSGVTIIQDGVPLTVLDSRGGSIFGNAGTSTADFAPGMTAANIPSSGSTSSRVTSGLQTNGPGGWFNPAAFIVGSTSVFPAYPVASGGDGSATGYGNTGLGIFSGPGQFNWDISLGKVTRVGGIREDGTLIFRAEFYDAFNHPQFANPSLTQVNASIPNTFGHITALSVNPRLIQFGLKYQF